MMHTTIKIALADDQLMLTEALATVINSFDNCQVLYTAANGKELIQKIETGPSPDVLILDLVMPVMDGYQTAEWLQNNRPTIKILMLTMHDTDTALVRLLKFGVKGFVKKDAHPSELRLAIKEMTSIGYYYNTGTAGRLANLMMRDDAGDIRLNKLDLNSQETALLKHCCGEHTFKQIAKEMSITPSSLDNIRSALCIKLSIRTRVGLALYAIKNGIVRLQ
jgi:two-component system, NarL family, invasion response regulator UvrY